MKLAFIFALLMSAVYAGIPLPGINIAQNKGVTASMGFGSQHQADCKTLWTWTSRGQYSYNSFLSGGASIRFLGGNLDSANNLIYQRYSMNLKFKYNQPNYVLFIGPVFSFENTNLNALRKEFTNIKDGGQIIENSDLGIDTKCRDSFTSIGSSIGFQSGGGYLLTPNWAFAFGHGLDLTLKGVFITSLSASIAFNLRERFEKLIANTNNFWVFFEYSPSFIKNDLIHYNILGVAIGF